MNSFFKSKAATVPFADVQHVEHSFHNVDLLNGAKKGDLMGIMVITKHTRWDMDADTWANNLWLGAVDATRFISEWEQWIESRDVKLKGIETPKAVTDALELIVRYGGIDEAHHKAWVLDQVVRVLIGDDEEYKKFVAEAKAGEDGPNTYAWNVGIAP